MGEEVIVDRELLRAIDADTRIRILKSLYERRKTQSELAEELKVSAPTVLEHVEKLEKAGLVKRIDEGRKWKYYELTQKGRKLISPDRKPVTAIIMLAVGLFILWYVFFVFQHSYEKQDGGIVLTEMEGHEEELWVARVAPEKLTQEETNLDVFIRAVLILAGLVFIVHGFMSLRESSKRVGRII